MSRGELEYVDLRDPSARQQYLDDSPTPIQDTSLPEISRVLPPPLPPPPPSKAKKARPPQPSEATREKKRNYFKTSLAQKLEMKAEFEKFGDSMSDVEYSAKLGIPLKNAPKLLTSLRKGISILPKGHYHRKSRVLPYQHLVKQILIDDPSISIAKLRECLIARTETNEGIVESGELDGLDGTSSQVQNGMSEPSNETSTIELNEERHEVHTPIPSESAIRKFLVGLTASGEEREVPVFSFKRETKRMPGANTAENKEKRIEAVQMLRMRMAQGYQWVCIDDLMECWKYSSVWMVSTRRKMFHYEVKERDSTLVDCGN